MARKLPRRVRILPRALLTLLIAGCASDGAIDGPAGPGIGDVDVPAEAPITMAAHGAVRLATGEMVTPTLELALSAQAYYLTRLLEEAAGETRDAFESLRTLHADRLAEGGPARVLANAELITWLIDAVSPEDAVNLRTVSGALRRPFLGSAPSDGVGVTRQSIETTTTEGGADYVAACSAAGVPTPPAWRSSSWVWRGPLSPDILKFAGGGTAFAGVYTAESANGICIALPRWEGTDGGTQTRPPRTDMFPPNQIQFLGIICQGNVTSKACFWDASQRINFDNTVRPIVGDVFLGGADLSGMGTGTCTDCHAGENAFIVHPGSNLDRGSILRAAGWVNPLVEPSWPQNRRPGRDLDLLSPGPGAQCLGCHNKAMHNRFPRLRGGLGSYCDTIVEGVLDFPTMPPAPSNPAAFATHADFIRDACGSAPAKATRFGGSSKAHDSFGFALELVQLGDVNNDGREDLIAFQFGSASDVWVARSNGSTFGTRTRWHSDFVGNSHGVHVGDFNGDGRVDITHKFNDDSRIMVATSSGTAFGAASTWWIRSTPIFGSSAVGDVNNDGKDDLVIFYARTTASATSTEVHVMLSTGSSFANPVRWHSTFAQSGSRYEVGDVNGDGFQDLVKFLNDGSGDVYVALSTGTSSGFGPATRWHGWFAPSPEMPRMGDIDGDGFDDVVTFLRGSTGDVFASPSNGTSAFVGTGDLWHPAFGLGSAGVLVGDVDGDGDADAVSVSLDSAGDVFVAKAIP